jgi:hypothetical protein
VSRSAPAALSQSGTFIMPRPIAFGMGGVSGPQPPFGPRTACIHQYTMGESHTLGRPPHRGVCDE